MFLFQSDCFAFHYEYKTFRISYAFSSRSILTSLFFIVMSSNSTGFSAVGKYECCLFSKLRFSEVTFIDDGKTRYFETCFKAHSR